MDYKVTLEDLAREAGVHRSTVSLALRDSPRISASRRAEIQALASRMGYQKNPLVSALMHSRRTKRTAKGVPIAFVTNYPTRYGWRPTHHPRPDFYPGAMTRAKALGYELEHFWLAEPGMTPRRFCEILLNRGIHGLIFGRLPPGQSQLSLRWPAFSCVALGMTLREPRLHRVTENHFDTVRQAMRRCWQYGYQRVGFLFSEQDDSPRVGARWRGAFLNSQLDLPSGHRVKLCPNQPPTFEQFRRWIECERPDALLASHARPVLGWLARMELRVPEDIGVIDLEADPELDCAGINYDPGKIGAVAVEMLVGLMHRNEVGAPENPYDVLMTGQWRDAWSLPDRKTPAREGNAP